MAEMADITIMQEMHAKMLRVKEIKAEMGKLKNVETKTKATKITTTTNIKISCESRLHPNSWDFPDTLVADICPLLYRFFSTMLCSHCFSRSSISSSNHFFSLPILLPAVLR
jgi:hypothetical protein